MFGIGQGELALILLFAFLVFGPDKLPGAGRTLGRALRQFRQAQEGFSKVVQTEVINPMTEDPKEGPSIEDELDADIDADADVEGSDTVKVQPHHKESFAERKARLDAERRAKEEAEAQKAEEQAAAQATEQDADVKPEGDQEANSDSEAGTDAVKKAESSEDVADSETESASVENSESAAETAVEPSESGASESVPEVDDKSEDADSASEQEDGNAEADAAEQSESEPDPLAALYGLSGNSLERVQAVTAELDERDAQRRAEAEALTPQDVVEAALNDETTSETEAEPEPEAAPQPKRIVTAARKKPRSSRPQTTEPGKGEGTE